MRVSRCLRGSGGALAGRLAGGAREARGGFGGRRRFECRSAAAPNAGETIWRQSEGRGGGEAGSDGREEGYNEEMQARMGGSLTYDHSRGMNYTRILPNLIVGSCLQTASDAAWLAEREGVGCVFSLQQDSDMAYFDLDLEPVLQGCADAGIEHVRCRINDFDPHDLRQRLPAAVASVASVAQQSGTVYIHCTAGLGRAPAVAIAYMFWVLGFDLMEAHALLTCKRPCNPKVDAIRQATCDLVLGVQTKKVKIGMKAPVNAQSVQVAGLDMGWDNPLPCQREKDRFVLERVLRAGRFQYKFIVDGLWTFSADSPVVREGGFANNYVDVVAGDDPTADYEIRQRLMSQQCPLTAGERQMVQSALEGRTAQ